MAMRLKGRGMTSTNFFRTIVSYGHEVDGSRHEFDQFFKVFVRRFRCQRHEPKSWHESNSRHEFHQLQERIAQAKGYLFYFFVEVMP
jgi:hypothetical protein